jgi:hypothetical protein
VSSDPPSPPRAAAPLLSSDLSIAPGESEAIYDRDMSPGTYMWLCVMISDFGWSTPTLLRDGRSRMLTYAHVCSRMLTYAHVCSRMLTYAHVCWSTRALLRDGR